MGETFPFVSSSVSLEHLQAQLLMMATRAQWRRLFPRAIIGRNEELNSLTIIEFYETSNEIGIDELQRCPPDSRDSWFVHHGKPAG